jgi:hypothetical protein
MVGLADCLVAGQELLSGSVGGVALAAELDHAGALFLPLLLGEDGGVGNGLEGLNVRGRAQGLEDDLSVDGTVLIVGQPLADLRESPGGLNSVISSRQVAFLAGWGGRAGLA